MYKELRVLGCDIRCTRSYFSGIQLHKNNIFYRVTLLAWVIVKWIARPSIAVCVG